MKTFLSLLLFFSALSQAATFNVSTTAELRTALSTAATNGEDDIINLAGGIYKTTDDNKGTFKYLSDQNDGLTLQGENTKTTIISGDLINQIFSYKSGGKHSYLILNDISFIDGEGVSSNGSGALSSNHEVTLNDCFFSNNKGVNGGAVAQWGTDIKLTINNCEFKNNTSLRSGGAIMSSAILEINNSLFYKNKTLENNGLNGIGGGAIYSRTLHSDEISSLIKNSIFIENISLSGNGGALNIMNATIDNVIIDNNSTGFSSGALYGNSLLVNNSIIKNNHSENLYGAGWTGNSIFFNSIVLNNYSKDSSGGDLQTYDGFFNSIYSGNSSGIKSNAAYLVNNIFFGNHTADVLFGTNGSKNISYLYNNYIDIDSLENEFIGEDNIYSDFEIDFFDSNNNNYRLTKPDLLIDAGSINFSGISFLDYDKDKNSRVIGESIDIGPYEYLDTDQDLIYNFQDPDDDNDGIADTSDTYPFITIGELIDTDSDGAPDTCDDACAALGMAADTDDDNDGIVDSSDKYPLAAIGNLTDTDSDGAPNTCDEACIDLGMAADSDDDNDSYPDEQDLAPLNPLISFDDNPSFTDFDINTTNSGISLLSNNTFVVTKQPSAGAQNWETYTRNYVISGKHYWEVTAKCGGDTLGASLSLVDENQLVIDTTRIITDGARDFNGNNYLEGFEQTLAEDVFMFALNMDDKTYFIGKNGNWFQSSNPILNQSPVAKDLPDTVKFKVEIGSRECQPNKLLANFGHTQFKYDPPVGYFKGYCTDNNCDVATGVDSDNDGIIDVFDKFPLIDISKFIDTDNDGAPDDCSAECINKGMTSDDDDDDDGILDTKDKFPLISLGNLLDTDSDGIPNDCEQSCLNLGMAADTDNDDDGIIDNNDTYPNISLNLLDNLNLVFNDDVGFIHDNLVWMRLDIAQSILSKFDAGRDKTNEYAIAKSLFSNDILKNWRHATYPELINLIESTTGSEVNIDITLVGSGLFKSSFIKKSEAVKLQQVLGKTSTQFNEGAQGYKFRTTGHLQTINGVEIWAEIVIYDYTDISFLTIRDRQSQINPDDSVDAGSWLVIPLNMYDSKLRLLDSDDDGIPNECGSKCQILNLSSDNDDDNDGIADTADAYPLVNIGELTDTDNDGAPDTCDESCFAKGMSADNDDDNDGVYDGLDAFPQDNSEQTDSDGDGLGDNYELDNGLSISDPDSDADGLKDGAEIELGTNPKLADSDDDSVIDGKDRFPLISIGELLDTDSDGAPDECDAACVKLGMEADTDDDNDGLVDISDAYPLTAIDFSQYKENYTFSAGQYQTCFISNSEPICWGTNPYIDFSQYIAQFDDILSISSGSNEICVTTNEGLFCNGTKIIDASENPSQTSVGGPHSCSIVNSGIKCWGSNGYGQLFIPENISNPSHVSVGWQHVCAIDDSRIICWGNRDKNLLDIPENITNPTDLSAGYYHTCAVGDGVVHCWGSNGFGRTNVPSELSKPFAVASGSRHSCALDENGVKCWGDNTYNQLEIPNNISNPIAISAGYLHTCILDDNGIKCWGDDTFGQSSVPLLNIDPDHDGVTNQRGMDQFPFNFLEWKDTDKDNIGDYLDYDSDNDGYFDSQVININSIIRNESNSSLDVTFLANEIIFKANYFLNDHKEWEVIHNNLNYLSEEMNQLFEETALQVISIAKAYSIVSNEEFELFFNDVINLKTSFQLNQPFQDLFPYDSSEWTDTDTDGIGNNSDKDDDNDGLTDEEELALGTSPVKLDTDGDGVNDNEDSSTVIVSSTFPSLNVTVIGSFNDISRGSFRLTSSANPNMLVIYPISITGNKMEFEYKFPSNVVSGEYKISSVAMVRENDEIVQERNNYYFDLINESEEVSEFSIQDPHLTYDSKLGLVNVRFIVDGLIDGITRVWPIGTRESLNMDLGFIDGSDQHLKGRVLNREVLNGINGANVLNFEYFIADEPLPETIYVRSIALTDKALNGVYHTIDTDSDNIIDVIDAYPFISVGGYSDINKNGAPEACDEGCTDLGMSKEDIINPKYYLLEQDSFEFASLTPTAKIIVTGSQGDNFFDIARYVDEVSVVGQTFLFSGSSEIDGVMIQPGVKYDLTNLKGSIDKLYFSGPLSEYAESILLDTATGVMQLSRLTDIGEEIVQFIATSSASDLLVFTDGALSTADVKLAVASDTPLTDLTLDTTSKALDAKITTGATVKHIVLDNNGAGVMALGPNISTLISGSSGVDQIYVPEGSNVDASNLKSSQDEIYLQGSLADYDSEFDSSGNIVLSRDVVVEDETQSERVVLASGGNAATNDLVIFKDQQVDTATLKQQVFN